MKLMKLLRQRSRSAFSIALVVPLVAIQLIVTAPPTSAAPGQFGGPMVAINGSGGQQTNGSDGLSIFLNADNSSAPTIGSDQVNFKNTYQYCCGGGGPILNIGGTAYGAAGEAAYNSEADWTSVSLISSSGSANSSGTTGTGSGSAHLRYSVTVSSRTYVVDRTVTYVYPNDFFTDSYSFTIPAGNSVPVKFYFGGDTAPGSDDTGYGLMLTTPVRSVISLNPVSNILFGYREISGGRTFNGAVSQGYSSKYSDIAAGNDLGFSVDTNVHDAGLQVQWNLGSTPGTYTGAMEQFVNSQATTLTAAYSAATGTANTEVNLNLNLVNSLLSSATGLGFTFALPTGLVIGTTSPTNGCSGSLTATVGSGTISYSGGSVSSANNCLIRVPVKATTPGDYIFTAASATGLAGGLTNGVNTQMFSIPGPPTWSDSTLGSMKVNQAFTDGVFAMASPSATYSVSAGSLPAGLTLDANTGAITGTPTASGTYSFTITATNTGGSIQQAFGGTVASDAATPPPAAGITAPIHLDTQTGTVIEVPIVDSPTPSQQKTVATPTGLGSWTVAPDGGVFTAGDAGFFGSLGGFPTNSPTVGIAPTSTGNGYYLVGEDGGVFAFGEETPFLGSMGSQTLNAPVKGIALACNAVGYYLVAGDGGVFAFGNVQFHGSMSGIALNQDMVGIVDACGRNGYWTFAADGGVFTFGEAEFYGSLANNPPPGGVIGMVSTANGDGYWLIGADRRAYGFGSAAN